MGTTARHRIAGLLLSIGAAGGHAGARAATPPASPSLPVPGRYEARFCVETPTIKASCSPADVVVGGHGAVNVSLSDLVYRLLLRTGQLDLTLLQGKQRIDGFTALYEWDGHTLHFRDAEKQVTYEIRIDRRRLRP